MDKAAGTELALHLATVRARRALPPKIGSEVPGLWGKRFCAPNKQARDGELARALWEKTEETIAAALARV